MPTRTLFLDTAFAIALSVQSDQHHEKAESLSSELAAEDARLVTTAPILLEIGDSLAKQKYRQAAAVLLESVEQDPNIEIVALSEELYSRASRLYRERADKEWGLTDCVSFVVMRDRGLTQALTADVHFQQAGFRTMLTEE